MTLPSPRTSVLWFAMLVALVACGGGGGRGQPDAPPGIDAAPIDGPTPDAACTPDDGSCIGPETCCSGVCADGFCVQPGGCVATDDVCTESTECCAGNQCRDEGGTLRCVVGLCLEEGGTCTLDSDCCSLNCAGTTCGPATGACEVEGGGCTANLDCCSFNCVGGTSCGSSPANCDPIGEACTGPNQCCSDFCSNANGEACGAGDVECRCRQVTNCRAQGELCSADQDCCNEYCDRPGGAAIGQCAAVGSCGVVGEPCGNPGISSACCSNACVDDGSGVATCTFLGGCLPIQEICATGADCCSGVCGPSGTTTDGRPILRCLSDTSCLEPGEVCGIGASSNCCPPGGGTAGCEPANSGVSRCFGGDPGCVIPSHPCTTVAECCTDLGSIVCEPGPGGTNICCLPDGEGCSFGDVCCGGVCAPDANGNLVCNPGCLATGGACTADADCCEGCCREDASGAMACSTDCGGCTLGQIGEGCSPTRPCCPGLVCAGPSEFQSCVLQ